MLRLVLVSGLLLAGAPLPGPLGWVSPAAAQSSRSGGYGRPGGAATSVRRPTSGGYSRPLGSGSAGTSSFSGGDRSVSRTYSGQAFRSYQQQQAPRAAAAAPPFGDRRPSVFDANPGPEFAPAGRRPATGYSGYGAGLPYAGGQSSGSGARFGAWDAVFLWSMLNAASSPSRTQFYRDNRDNPDYLAWRREAERAAQQDPAVAARLAAVDSAATDPGRRPPAAPESGSGGLGIVILVIILAAAAFLALRFLRRRPAAAAVPGLSGSAQSRFRVGMTFPLDPSPFLLAARATKVAPPQGEGLVSVQAVGLATDGSVPLNRLYLPGDGCFLQLHLAASGAPDECRYFSQIDEVTPASADEWGFWLDPLQGMIGWPQFQTKDGKLYDRVWAPGAARVPPRQETETIQDARGTRQRTLLSMVYGAPTGAAPPAPDTEYILVSAVDDAGRSWVEVHAGIDVNPATLTLPAVAL